MLVLQAAEVSGAIRPDSRGPGGMSPREDIGNILTCVTKAAKPGMSPFPTFVLFGCF